ncbi:MAG: lytic transglycosylase domain-containing protein [Gemmatimonadota bacterium]
MQLAKPMTYTGIGVLVASVAVVLETGEATQSAVRTETVLPATVVEPPVQQMMEPSEELIAEAQHALRRKAIREAAKHYDIRRDLAATIHDIAVEEGIEPDLAFGLVWVESRFDPEAVSHAGAVGLAQLMPATAKGLDPDIRSSELFDPERNLRLGMRYLRHLTDRYDGNHRMALIAYNRGPGTVARVRAAGEDPSNGYAGMVLENRLPDIAPLQVEGLGHAALLAE